MTLPVTLGFFTDSFTFRTRGLTVGYTVGGFTDGYTFGTVFSFTCFIWAFYFTFRLFTFDITDSVSRFLTGGVASGGFTDRVTDGWTFRVITLPGTFWVTLGVVGVGLAGSESYYCQEN
jgi:hypothetical protein